MSIISLVSKLRIGASSSRLLSGGNLRAFQTLSTPATTRSSEERRNYSAREPLASVGQWILSAQTRSMASMPESANFRDGKPTLEYAKLLPKTFASMTNDQVLHFAELKIPEACRECIVRNVMDVDQIDYDEALKVFKEIAKTNREGMLVAALPFYVGFGASFTGALVSIPLVFNLKSVEWFNEAYVTTELPPPEDLETWLEVGSASWGWMEPVLGQVSFFLLCMQFARSQLQNLGLRPYYHLQQERRAKYLVEKYPQYDAEFLANFSRIDRLAQPHVMED